MTNQAAPEFVTIKEFDRRQRRDQSRSDFDALETIDPLIWDGAVVPERRWIVPEMIPEGYVTMISGDGGVGKSLLMLQLLVSAALGKPWLGLPVRRCKCIGVFCEDDADELHGRLDSILKSYDATYADLGDLRLVCRVDEDNLLMEFHDQWSAGKVTRFYGSLRQLVLDHGCELLVLDSLHDFFAGNENSRPQAHQFIVALRALAREMKGAVAITMHPSVAGRANGTGDAGSTGWPATVRSRLYLTNPQRQGVEDLDYRELKNMKANYGRRGNVICMRWESGVFVVDDVEPMPLKTVDPQDFDNRALAEMRAMIVGGAQLSANFAASNAFVNALRKRPKFLRVKQPEAIACQERLIESKRAVLVTVGPPSRSRVYIRPTDVAYKFEKGSRE